MIGFRPLHGLSQHRLYHMMMMIYLSQRGNLYIQHYSNDALIATTFTYCYLLLNFQN